MLSKDLIVWPKFLIPLNIYHHFKCFPCELIAMFVGSTWAVLSRNQRSCRRWFVKPAWTRLLSCGRMRSTLQVTHFLDLLVLKSQENPKCPTVLVVHSRSQNHFSFLLVPPQISVTKSEEERDNNVVQDMQEENDADHKSSRNKEPSIDEEQPKQEVRTTPFPVLSRGSKVEQLESASWNQSWLYEAYRHYQHQLDCADSILIWCVPAVLVTWVPLSSTAETIKSIKCSYSQKCGPHNCWKKNIYIYFRKTH